MKERQPADEAWPKLLDAGPTRIYPLRRGPGNDVTAVWGIAQGASMIRVHDVAALGPIVRMADALRHGPGWSPEARG